MRLRGVAVALSAVLIGLVVLAPAVGLGRYLGAREARLAELLGDERAEREHDERELHQVGERDARRAGGDDPVGGERRQYIGVLGDARAQ